MRLGRLVLLSVGALARGAAGAAGGARGAGPPSPSAAARAPKPARAAVTPSVPAPPAKPVGPPPALGGAELFPAVSLRRGKARLFKEGSPLVYGGALNDPEPHLNLQPAQFVRVTDGVGETVGWGPYNAASMFRVRLLRNANEPIARAALQRARQAQARARKARAAEAAPPAEEVAVGAAAVGGGEVEEEEGPAAYELVSLLRERLSAALSLRRRHLGLPRSSDTAYRWVNGEGDRLSGLIVDCLGPVVVVSSSALWCEVYREQIESAVRELADLAVTPVDAPAGGGATAAVAGGASQHQQGSPKAFVLWRRSEARLKQDGWSRDDPTGARAGRAGNGDIVQEEEEEVTEETAGDVPAAAGAGAALGGEASDAELAALALATCSVDLRATKVTESGLSFICNPLSGQKTGFYCDQRENRLAMRALVTAALAAKRSGSTSGDQQQPPPAAAAAADATVRVLDLCCHTAGFALNAALAAAQFERQSGGQSVRPPDIRITAVDSSSDALAAAQANAAANGFGAEAISFVRADVASFMAAELAAKRGAATGAAGTSAGSGSDGGWRAYDIVVLDPPKLAPSARSLDRAKRKYESLNAAALQLVSPGGVLVSCSCSGAVAQEAGLLVKMVHDAAAKVGRSVTVLRVSGAAADHPVNPMYPEGAYLTVALFAVS